MCIYEGYMCTKYEVSTFNPVPGGGVHRWCQSCQCQWHQWQWTKHDCIRLFGWANWAKMSQKAKQNKKNAAEIFKLTCS